MIYKTPKRNTPIATLIKNYVNKKSGKVAESRKEIQRRFEHLDWKDQKKIIMAYLDSCKIDRQWIYSKLLYHWDKSFETKVKEVWDKYHEQMCSWSIIRYFPISYIKENMASFTEERDYYFICLRLAEDPDYVIDRFKLRTIDYLSVLYHSGRTLSDEEAQDILYGIVHDFCVSGTLFYGLNEKNSNQCPFDLSNYRNFDLARFYLTEMDKYEVWWSFVSWNWKVRQTIDDSPDYFLIENLDSSSFEAKMRYISVLKKYTYIALDDKYKSPSDPPMNNLLAIENLNPFTSLENLPNQEDVPMPPSDRSFLEEKKQSNTEVKKLVDDFELELFDGDPPF